MTQPPSDTAPEQAPPGNSKQLPIHYTYISKLKAIRNEHPQLLYPGEFLQYVLLDRPQYPTQALGLEAIIPLEHKMAYVAGSLRSNIFNKAHGDDRRHTLPKPLQAKLAALTGKENFWGRSSFSSAEAEGIAFDLSVDISAINEQFRAYGGHRTRGEHPPAPPPEIIAAPIRPAIFDRNRRRNQFNANRAALAEHGTPVEFTVGEFLQHTLLENGISDEAFVAKLKLSPGYMSKIFNQNAPLSAPLVNALVQLSDAPAEFWKQERYALPATEIPKIDLSREMAPYGYTAQGSSHVDKLNAQNPPTQQR